MLMRARKRLPFWSQKSSGTANRRQRDHARTRSYSPFETVLARTGLSRSTIYRKIAEGTFPPQIKISVNGTGWHESDINRWIADPVSWRPTTMSN